MDQEANATPATSEGPQTGTPVAGPAGGSPTADEHGHDGVLYSVEDGVATITLNRPDAMNALTLTMRASLLEALERARDDAAVRAVLLTGAGRGFCAGQDLRSHAANLEAGIGLDNTVRNHYNPIIMTVAGMNKPVIAAVNGIAAGAGAALAFACDFRIVADGAKFAMAFAGIGLAPDSGASWTLPRLVGPARARELLMLSEPVDAARALELGMATSVVPGDRLAERARELAVRLAQGPTQAYGAIKQALDYSASHTLEDSLEVEADLQDVCVKTEDHHNATKAFLSKQRPVFEGR